MNRRKAIQLTGVSIALLSGCANTGTPESTSEPTPVSTEPVATTPLESATMLSVANANFHVLDDRDIETNEAVRNDNGDPKLNGIVVDRAAVDLFHLEMSALQMTVHKKFDQALLARLNRDGISLTPYSAADEAIAVRANGDVATLGTGTEAVIDVRVKSLGYRPIASAMAMTPEATVELNVVQVSDSAKLVSKRYNFDWRDVPNDTRHFRCEASDTFNSIDALMASLPKAAATLDRGTMLMVDRVADDIVRTYRGQEVL